MNRPENLHSLLDLTQDKIVVIDSEGTYQYANAAVERILGYDPDSFVGTNTFEYIHAEDVERVRAVFERLIRAEGARTQTIQFRHRTKDGGWVWLESRARNRVDSDLGGYVISSRDITDRRRRERQLEVLDDFLRHNLRNTMNVILGHAELASAYGDRRIEKGMDAILKTGEQLLATAEKERRIVEVLVDAREPTTIDLAAVLSDLAGEFRSRFPEATIETDLEEDGAVVAIPEIRDAIEELLENAIDHANRTHPPEIQLRIELEADTAVIRIRDTGDPIPENEFEPLSADGPPSDIYHPTGLGLWLVYWIVDISKGSLGFERRPDGDGNVITIRLPRATRV
jgi:PAS domain S-box-containing protein